MTITAAADGSALGNPGPAGWAWYIDDSNWRSGGWPHGTNNMGELHAVLDLLQSTQDLGEPLRVLCDSQYVINSITKWMKGWKKKGWKKSWASLDGVDPPETAVGFVEQPFHHRDRCFCRGFLLNQQLKAF